MRIRGHVVGPVAFPATRGPLWETRAPSGERALLTIRAPGEVAPGRLEAWARIDSPHVAHLLDAGVDEGRWVIVLERIEGTAMSELAGASLRARAEELMSGLVAGLAACHGAGLVHGDVAPSNVVIAEEDGRPVLVDLVDPPEVVAGTPGWSAGSGEGPFGDHVALARIARWLGLEAADVGAACPCGFARVIAEAAAGGPGPAAGGSGGAGVRGSADVLGRGRLASPRRRTRPVRRGARVSWLVLAGSVVALLVCLVVGVVAPWNTTVHDRAPSGGVGTPSSVEEGEASSGAGVEGTQDAGDGDSAVAEGEGEEESSDVGERGGAGGQSSQEDGEGRGESGSVLRLRRPWSEPRTDEQAGDGSGTG